MKWNEKSLRRAGNQVAKAVGERDFEGKSADEFVTWLKGLCDDTPITYNGLIDNSEFDADAIRKAWKAVIITPNAGEEIIVNDESVETESMDEDEEVKMTGEEDEVTKAYKNLRKAVEKNGGAAKNFPGLQGIVNGGGSTKGIGFKFGDRRSAVLKSYDRAVKDGKRLGRTGEVPVFEDGERMEAFNALARFGAMGNHDYPQKSMDEKIITKTGLVGQNSTGGALVFGEYFPELIENFSESGAARAAAGIEPMREGVKVVSKLGADVEVGDVGEGDAMTANDFLVGNVELVAKKSYALCKVSMELLNDSAFSVTDIIGRSMMRSLRAYEDDCYFNSANNRQGLSSKIGANSTLDANLAARTTANWGGYEIDDIQNLLGTLPDWAKDDPKFGIACSWQFYMRVLRRFMASAGGNTGAMLAGGVAGPGNTSTWDWDGIPIYINNKAPKTYNADQIDLYAGAFSWSTKFGVVTGSESIATTDQRWFDEDLFGIKMTQRWAINPHDVSNRTLANGGSGIVALKA